MTTYGDVLRTAMLDNGLPVSPIQVQGDRTALRFDSVDVSEDRLTFLWLGKPVYMVRRHAGMPSPVRGETAITIN